MIESYININTNEEAETSEKTFAISYKLLIMLLIFLSFNFAIRNDAYQAHKLIKINGNNYYEDIYLVNYNRYYLNNYIPNVKNFDFFNITHVSYYFSFKYKVIRMEYNIAFYNENEELLTPSDFALYKELQLMCTLEIDNSNNVIHSYPNMVDNKYYQCVEYFNIHERVIIGIKIYQTKESLNAYPIKFFTEAKFNYNNFYYQNDNLFDPFFINNNYIKLVHQINENKKEFTPNLKRDYLQYPFCSLKRNSIKNYEKWYFRNIYNDHFCFCVGVGCLFNIDQNCKHYFYLSVIDKNQHLYEKTDYLFVDFIFSEYSYDDTYPVFKEMLNQNYPVHYMTENQYIYNTHCYRKAKCESILYATRANYTISGDFLEKYLTLFLKLKAVVCSRQLNFYSNVFYITDYIQYIVIGHSLLYFKYFSIDNDNAEKRKFDKLMLPPSERVINLAKSFGWEEDDILQINFPRWDKYNNLDDTNNNNNNFNNIRMMEENYTRMNNSNNNISNINNTGPINNNSNNDINNTNNINNSNEININNNQNNSINNSNNISDKNTKFINNIGINNKNNITINNNEFSNYKNNITINSTEFNDNINNLTIKSTEINTVITNLTINIYNTTKNSNISETNNIDINININISNITNNSININYNNINNTQNNSIYTDRTNNITTNNSINDTVSNINYINNSIFNNYTDNVTINNCSIINNTNESLINVTISNIISNLTNIGIFNNGTSTNDTAINIEIIQQDVKEIKKERFIFIMFSWRNIMKECEISNYYFKNISRLLTNERLNKQLKDNNVKIFFTIHGLVINKYRSTYKSLLYYNKNIRFIEQHDIAYCIAKSSLIITDFSSLSFDFVYMRRPYILYIPDIDEPNITNIYKPEFFDFYEKVKEGTIRFENMVYSVKEVVDKIAYYIKNDFILDDDIKNFYDSFGIKQESNTVKLINYLVNLR